LNLQTGVLLAGIDVWKSISLSQKEEQMRKDVEEIFGDNILNLFSFLDIKEKANALLKNNSKVVTNEWSTSEFTDKDKETTFKNVNASISQIKRDLATNKFTLSQVKSSNYTNDIRSSNVLKAADKEEVSLLTLGGKGTMFFKDEQLNKFDGIKFEIYSDESRVKFFNDHFTREHLDNVFSEII